jgi:UDPglucose 6-dehydrogenase
MKIGIIGTGYVGLVTGACFADFGIIVTCNDLDEGKIASLKKGVIPYYEPGLEELVKANVRRGRLSFTTDIVDAVEGSDAVFIAVGTPARKDGSANLSFVEEAAKGIARSMKDYIVVVMKSTVPAGTTCKIQKLISNDLRGGVDFDITVNPEFLREGTAIEDFRNPHRVIIGANSDRAIAVLKNLYKPVYPMETPFLFCNIETAEIVKQASNAFLATKISFINEMAALCERVGADVHTVAQGMGLDDRIGAKFLHAGPGFGGSCLPKDSKALVHIAETQGVDMKIVRAALDANVKQHKAVVGKIRRAMKSLKGKTIAILGLSFKPNTDDMRDAPSIAIIKELLRSKANVRAYDPVAIKNAKEIMPDITYASDTYRAVKGADAVVIVTEWNEFRNLDLERLKSSLKTPMFFDFRNIYEPAKMKEMGFEYYSVGRPLC